MASVVLVAQRSVQCKHTVMSCGRMEVSRVDLSRVLGRHTRYWKGCTNVQKAECSFSISCFHQSSVTCTASTLGSNELLCSLPLPAPHSVTASPAGAALP